MWCKQIAIKNYLWTISMITFPTFGWFLRFEFSRHKCGQPPMEFVNKPFVYIFDCFEWQYPVDLHYLPWYILMFMFIFCHKTYILNIISTTTPKLFLVQYHHKPGQRLEYLRTVLWKKILVSLLSETFWFLDCSFCK